MKRKILIAVLISFMLFGFKNVSAETYHFAGRDDAYQAFLLKMDYDMEQYAEQSLEIVQVRCVIVGKCEKLVKVDVDAFKQSANNLFLVFEVVIEVPGTDARLGSDVIGGGLGRAISVEDAQGRLENSVFCRHGSPSKN